MRCRFVNSSSQQKASIKPDLSFSPAPFANAAQVGIQTRAGAMSLSRFDIPHENVRNRIVVVIFRVTEEAPLFSLPQA